VLRCPRDCVRLAQQESLDLIKPDPARPFQRSGRLDPRGAGFDAERPAMIKQEPDALVSGRLLPVIVSERNVELDRSRPQSEQLRHPDGDLSQTAKHRAGACGARPLDKLGSRARAPRQVARIHLDPQRGSG
jgi:hypothetical protein